MKRTRRVFGFLGLQRSTLGLLAMVELVGKGSWRFAGMTTTAFTQRFWHALRD